MRLTKQTIIAISLGLCSSMFGMTTASYGSNDSYLFNIYFRDESRGWVLGAANGQGFMFQTADGGKHWEERYRSADGLSKIRFANERIGWMVGGNGLILRTSDAGVSWKRQESGVSVLLTGLAVVDQNNAWATGASGTLLYTRDGGETWNRRELNSTIGISDVFFLDAEHGWAVGYGTILWTTDGGKSWGLNSSGKWKPLSSVFFANQNLGWIAAGPVILRTTDGGKRWAETVPPSEGQLAGLTFLDAKHGWVAKSRGEEGSVVQIPGKDTLSSESFVLSTSDGGQTWQTTLHLASQVDHSAWILNVFFINRTNGWAVGRNGLIMRTIDGGKTWQRTEITLALRTTNRVNH